MKSKLSQENQGFFHEVVKLKDKISIEINLISKVNQKSMKNKRLLCSPFLAFLSSHYYVNLIFFFE